MQRCFDLRYNLFNTRYSTVLIPFKKDPRNNINSPAIGGPASDVTDAINRKYPNDDAALEGSTHVRIRILKTEAITPSPKPNTTE